MRRSIVILLVAAASVGGLAYAHAALRAAAVAPLALSVSPSAQTTARGTAAGFSVDVGRPGTFTAPVRLTVAGLPAGVRAHWRLPSGAVTTAPVLTQNGAVLRLGISTRTPLGTRPVTVRATGGGRTVRRTLRLTVTAPDRRRLSLTVGPARRVVSRGAVARYSVRLARPPGFRGRVWLRVLRVPRGERATLSARALVVSATAGQRTGAHRLVVTATAWVRGARRRLYAVVTLSVVRPRRFTISGDLPTLLFPGADAPLDPRLTNPNTFPVRIRTLRVTLRPRTSRPGCDGPSHYAVRQYTGTYPLLLRPGHTRLSTLVRDASVRPRIGMRDLASDQGACKGAVVRLDYAGLATR